MRHCINCSKDLTSRKQIKYCSNICQQEYEYKLYIESWKKGNENGLSGTGISGYIRKYLFRKHKDKCSICGWSEKNIRTDLIPLEVEHIDGDFRNNKEENLTLLCPNCHSLTATYGNLNKGKGRRTFKKREK
jgi:hypothetical protein